MLQNALDMNCAHFPETSPDYPEIAWVEGIDDQGRACCGWHSRINGARYGETWLKGTGTREEARQFAAEIAAQTHSPECP